MHTEDTDKCAEIYHDISLCGKILTDLTAYKNYFAPFVNDDDKYAICFLKEDEVIGFLTALQVPDMFYEFMVYIDNIAVAPIHQKKGYGSVALKLFIDSLPRNTIKHLITEKSLPAYVMYEKLGFEDIGGCIMESSPIINVLKKYRSENQIDA